MTCAECKRPSGGHYPGCPHHPPAPTEEEAWKASRSVMARIAVRQAHDREVQE